MTEREQLQYLWQVIDQLNTAAVDARKRAQYHADDDSLASYVLRKTNAAMKTLQSLEPKASPVPAPTQYEQGRHIIY